MSSKSTIQPTSGASSCHLKSLTYSWRQWEGAKHKVSESLLEKDKGYICIFKWKKGRKMRTRQIHSIHK
jgi:hypothetical protein